MTSPKSTAVEQATRAQRSVRRSINIQVTIVVALLMALGSTLGTTLAGQVVGLTLVAVGIYKIATLAAKGKRIHAFLAEEASQEAEREAAAAL